MNTQIYPRIVLDILDRLKSELPARLTYHGAHHTQDVIEEIVTLVNHDNLEQKNKDLLILAAAFHDSGFLYKHNQNEDLASQLAQSEMQKAGAYSEEEILEVKNCILSTKMQSDFSRTAKTELSKYLMDADLGNLGREDFLHKTELLITELNADRKAFFERSLKLLSSHKWLTPAANALRQEGLIKNIAKVKEILATL